MFSPDCLDGRPDIRQILTPFVGYPTAGRDSPEPLLIRRCTGNGKSYLPDITRLCISAPEWFATEISQLTVRIPRHP